MPSSSRKPWNAMLRLSASCPRPPQRRPLQTAPLPKNLAVPNALPRSRKSGRKNVSDAKPSSENETTSGGNWVNEQLLQLFLLGKLFPRVPFAQHLNRPYPTLDPNLPKPK